ncbi:MAG TPA: hypothetical protein VJT78_05385 [Candidatus Dormibacteraeota bacterium]|nr:hypothetical protein [Candidatus Dormibacteraeota bacterium]
MVARLRPYWLHAYLLAYTPIGLYADSRVTAQWQQWLLGGLTFAVLYLAALKAPKEQRLQVWMCVIVATGFEIVGSLVWGVYRYRLHNLPLYVPPGHGIVYLFGLLAAQTPVVMRYGRRVAHVVLAGAGTWALAGLTLLPLVTGRFDLQGALCLPVFAYFLLRSPRWPLFAAIFVIVSELEISGTFFGDWHWMPVAPWTHIPSGNPPSVIAGGYCVIDGSVLAAMWAYRVGLKTIMTRIRTTSSPSPGPSIAFLRESRTNSGESS